MATSNAAEILNQLDVRWIEKSIRVRHDRKMPAFNIIAQKFTIPAANLVANYITRLWLFPAGSYILDWRSTPSDLDTDGTPAITYSILTTDNADTTKVTLVSGSTNGQAAAGSDSLIAAVKGRYVGNQWCVFKVGTAADVAAAGTLKVYCAFAVGVINRSNPGLFLGDAEA